VTKRRIPSAESSAPAANVFDLKGVIECLLGVSGTPEIKRLKDDGNFLLKCE
jgi:hypothetical protein